MKILLIDNHDSFTYNLYQLIGQINHTPPQVIQNDDSSWNEACLRDFDRIVISPGPGQVHRETDFGISRSVILKSEVPVLGVCLGHQGIGWLYGAQLQLASEPYHGRASLIWHHQSPLFKGIPSPFSVIRYHSWVLATQLPHTLQMTAWTTDVLGNTVVMGLQHQTRPLYGVQLHPESILSQYGHQLLKNFLDPPFSKEESRTLPPRQKYGISHLNEILDSATTPPFKLRSSRFDRWIEPESVFRMLYSKSDYSFWLDSSKIQENSRFSFMGDTDGPHSEILFYQTFSKILTLRTQKKVKQFKKNIFLHLKESLFKRQLQFPFEFPFIGGFVGYLGYEMKQECGIPGSWNSTLPDSAWIFSDRLLVFDHQERVIYALELFKDLEDSHPSPAAYAHTWLNQIEETLKTLWNTDQNFQTLPLLPLSQSAAPVLFHPRHSKAEYLDRIKQCQEWIQVGESYELCLTNSWSTPAHANPIDLYCTLRHLNPAPYGAFLKFSDFSILSSSPECFLKGDLSGKIQTKPIKGTAPRSQHPITDLQIQSTLQTDEKNQAENLMIVDLLRNDLGRICTIGSVVVEKLMALETYATVHQLVSTISGQIPPHTTHLDVLEIAFPGGSMTGAPKERSIALLDELEGVARGPYSGTLGYLSLNGTLEQSIVIRALIQDSNGLTVHAGGAITALSHPETEYNETLLKAQASMRTVAMTLTGHPHQFKINDPSFY